MRMRLSYDINGCIVMTYGPCQRGAESRAAESCPRSAAADRAPAGSRRAPGARLFHFVATGVSLPAACAAAARAGCRQRAKAGVHRQAVPQADSARTVVRICQRDLHQRSRQQGAAGVPSTKRRSWLSRGQSRHAHFSWNIDLTACWPTSWLRLISCWCPTGDERLQGHLLNHTILIRR